jgi:formate-dependent nitrite reductase membrane component NrfD
METHEWMIKQTHQTEWIDRRGIFLWLALYTGGLGGGLYLISLYFNSLVGMVTALFIVAVLKGTFHLAFLGKPWRFWRIVSRPQTSWLARGFIFVIAFIALATLQILVSLNYPGSVWESILKGAAGLMALGVATYTGFVLNNVKSIPFWNSSLLPLLFLMCGFLGGFGLSIILALYGGNINLASAEAGSRLLLVINALLIVVYLWRSTQKRSSGKKSVEELMQGKSAVLFWVGVMVLGIVVPLIIAVLTFSFHDLPARFLLLGVVCEIIGGLSLRYCILKAGIYQPILQVPFSAKAIR